MQEWLSLSEIKKLIGSLYSLMGLRKKADREAWEARPRKAVGGGLEYILTSLPQEIQYALKIKSSEENIKALEARPAGKLGAVEGAKLRIMEETKRTVARNRRLEGMHKAEYLKGAAKKRMDAKLEIIKLWEDFERDSTDGKTAAQYLFCAAYSAGEIEAPDWVKETISKISQSSLMAWIKQARKEGIVRLAGRYGNRKKTGVFYTNQELHDFVVGTIGQCPHCCAKQVWLGICARQQSLNLESVPSLRTIARFMDDWKRDNMAEYELMKNPDRYRGKFMPAFGNASQGIDRYLQLWEADSTPTDVMLKDGRHTIIGVIDVASRRPKVYISKTSNSVAVGLLMRQAIIDWGVPECVKTDNGTDYVSRHITELFESLQIQQETCPPFTPKAKPHIERFFKSLSHGFLEMLPGYIGHSVPDRVDIEQRKSFAERLSRGGKEKAADTLANFTAEELQQQCNEWIENVYMKSPHSGLKGKKPIDFIAEWINSGKPVRRITDEMSIRALDYLLAEVPGNNGIRKITKNGIHVDKLTFVAPELGVYIGEEVRVKYNPFDAGCINVYRFDGSLLCVAQCPEITGVSRAEVAQIATQKSKQLQGEQRKKHRSIMRKTKPKNVSKEILQHYKNMPDRNIGPENVVEHTTPALQQAADQIGAIEVMEKPMTVDEINASAAKVTPEGMAVMAKIIDLEKRREADAEREISEKKARAKRYEALRAVNFKGISVEDEQWRRVWEETPEGRTYIHLKRYAEEHGLTYNVG